jgi:hypothetical protein
MYRRCCGTEGHPATKENALLPRTAVHTAVNHSPIGEIEKLRPVNQSIPARARSASLCICANAHLFAEVSVALPFGSCSHSSNEEVILAQTVPSVKKTISGFSYF